MEQKNRKELREAYKNRKVMGGVYVVRNSATGKTLVMSTTDLPGAVNRYAFARQTGGCFHPKLQKDLERCGKDAFSFETLEELEKKWGYLETRLMELWLKVANKLIIQEEEKLQGWKLLRMPCQQ